MKSSTSKPQNEYSISILKIFITAFSFMVMSTGCTNTSQTPSEKPDILEFNLEMANKLSRLAFNCIDQEYPNKPGQVLGDDSDLKPPRVLRPAFYGCFDWHSAVHGHWTLVKLMKNFPNLDNTVAIREKINKNLTPDNIHTEISFWEGQHNKSFERTYGWAWLLKLQEELLTWDDPDAIKWASALKPMATMLEEKYVEFLPKLNYPIRVGEHTNTAFGLSFAYDFAVSTGNKKFEMILKSRALDYYEKDTGCPLSWEPSGYDFLSPCLEEAQMMSKIMSEEEYRIWWNSFLPKFQDLNLNPATSSDLTDGKLVHLVGLNLSRAWCMFDIGQKLDNPYLTALAEKHINASIEDVVNGDYAGEHWLASFAVMAMTSRK